MKRLLLLSACLIPMLAACKDKELAETEPDVQHVLAVTAGFDHRSLSSFTGTIEPRTRTSLGFRILGRIVEQNASLGAQVRKGDVLARIDPVALALGVRAAEAEIGIAEARLANADATARRVRILVGRNVASQAQIELAEEALATAQAGLENARARLAKAKEQLGYAVLVAEFDCVVTAVPADVGQVVTPGQPVVAVAGSDQREAVVDVPDHLARSFTPGEPFQVALQAGSRMVATGSLREIAPQSDAATRTRRLRITLGAARGSFRLGTTVAVTPERRRASRIELPASGLIERDGKQMVWVIDPVSSRVSLCAVTVAARSDSSIEVADGLASGSQVVVAGVHGLKPGQTVRISQE
jgi:RND family efflux transporter MFP subunit